MYSILAVDDDRDIVSALRIYLVAAGYTVYTAANGREALDILREQEIHLILMDLMMPEMDGLSATAMLREESNVPVIMLTAKSQDTDKVFGLEMGADDYITKPFVPAELMARVKSQLRRYTNLGGMAKSREQLHIGGILLDNASKTVTVDGEQVALTPLEFAILKLLMERPGRVHSSAQIYEQVWSGSAFGGEGTVAVHIRHLREKLEINPAEPRYIKVVWGQGYKFEEVL